MLQKVLTSIKCNGKKLRHANAQTIINKIRRRRAEMTCMPKKLEKDRRW